MSDAKKLKKTRKHLSTLTRGQLVALATQRTEMGYQAILKCATEELVNTLAQVANVLKPIDVSGVVEVSE